MKERNKKRQTTSQSKKTSLPKQESPPGDAFRLHLRHWLSWVSSLLSLAHIADLDLLVSMIT